MKFKLHPERKIRHILSMPFIYGMIVPSVALDVTIEMYHRVCFPLYGISYVPRRKYIRVDRQKLSYLTNMEKVNCMYCGYINGLYAYAVQIAGETEKYWCGIKHVESGDFVPPKHHQEFLEYDDKSGYEKLKKKE